MAVAIATFTPGNIGVNRVSDTTQKLLKLFGNVAITAGPATYTAGGILIVWSVLADLLSSLPPFRCRVESQPAAGSGVTTKYIYQFLPGTTQLNCFLQIFTGAAAQSALTELTAAAAIPAAVSGDTIVFEALLSKFVS